MKREPRYRLYRIDPDEVLSILNWDQYMQIALPVTKGIIPGASIEAINHDYSRRCFMAKVYHESFDIVPRGSKIPIDKEWIHADMRIIDVDTYIEACNAKGK